MGIKLEKVYGICPFCGGDNTDSFDEELIEGHKVIVVHNFYCQDCEKHWDEIFIYIGYKAEKEK